MILTKYHKKVMKKEINEDRIEIKKYFREEDLNSVIAVREAMMKCKGGKGTFQGIETICFHKNQVSGEAGSMNIANA